MLRVGIVGCGLIGRKRANVIKADRGCCLSCAADIEIFNAAALVKEFGGEGKGVAYKDWEEMLEKEALDAVVVATPNKFLKKITLAALQRGIHVLCEKPLGRNTAEARKMVDQVSVMNSSKYKASPITNNESTNNQHVVLKTGFNHRHHPGIFKAHEMVEKGELGPLYFIRCAYGHGGRPGYDKEWRASKEICGGGELLDQGVHVVDLFRWFLGDFDEAFGYTPTYFWNMEVEDNAFAVFRTAKGQTASMHTSWTQWKNRFTFEVFGEAGYLIINGLGGSYGKETLTFGKRPMVLEESGQRSEVGGQKKGSAPQLNTLEGNPVQRGRDYADYAEEKGREEKINGLAQRRKGAKTSEARITNQRITNNSSTLYAGGAPSEERIVFDGPDVSWDLEWKEFTTAIREKREPLGSGLDGLEANRMIEAVYRSAAEKRPVKMSEGGALGVRSEG